MSLKDMPAITEALIKALEQRFSCSPPKASEKPSEMYVRAGAAEVISYLKAVLDDQNVGSSKQESTHVLFESEDPRPSTSSGNTSRRQARRSAGSR